MTISLIVPATIMVYGAAFFVAWYFDRKQGYLRLMGLACLVFAAGACAQILSIPRDIGLNALFSCAFYTAATLLVAESMMRRYKQSYPMLYHVVVGCAIMLSIAYFFYIERSLTTRVYIQNFGYGLILLITAFRLFPYRKRSWPDAALFWVLFLFAASFFPRTILTFGGDAPVGAAAFGNSVFWQFLQLWMAISGSVLAVTVLVIAMYDVMKELRVSSDIDGLTNILNRKAFETRAERMLSDKLLQPISLIIVDIDHFKKVNDTYGHRGGDAALREVAAVLRHHSRKDDLVGRLGGEEFAVLAPRCSLHEAFEQAERLRQAIAAKSLPEISPRLQVTASFGIATLRPGETWLDIYDEADQRLYEAKRGGRNRVIASPEDDGVEHVTGVQA
ncbi:GGDEF domain-containing protein [Limoniibacter endophyticus]|uniref:GGDEF domain-containing protein n=1 Tax=Limoniibacter endophyticus TaxID=1565040 RepID=UPI00167A12CE|nr:GGDEF domain-containing protein [Limoniibacter endophyticus]